MLSWWKNLGLQARFMLITSGGLLAVVLCVIVLVGWFEISKVEQKLRDTSQNELMSLSALVSSAMEQRQNDKADVAIAVFNRWFEHRNADYPGKLWSVWSPQMANYMVEAEKMAAFTSDATTEHVTKPPHDAIDEEVLRTGKPVGRFVDGAYRYSLPIILGVTAGTNQKSCYDCHGKSMNLTDGQVLSVFSSSLSTTAEFAGLRRLLAEMAGAALAGTLVLMLAIRTIFARVISRRLVGMTAAMLRLAEGDRTVEVPVQSHADEIGAMARVMQVFKHHVVESYLATERESERLQVELGKNTALRDMAVTIEMETSAALAQISLRTAAMTTTAGGMSSSASRTEFAAVSAAEAAGQAVANAQTVANAADQLAASIMEIGEQVSHSAEVANRAVTAGSETRATIEALNGQVARIGAVVEMIGEIASRTNLLALNATIEAARAGDAGKGFAVVASEVKSLATQTARSTQDIGRHINEVRSATTAAVAAVARIEQTISEINAIASAVASAVEKQSAATTGIAFNVTETASAANDMSDRIIVVSAEAEQTEKHAVSVRENAAALEVAMTELRHAIVRVVRTSSSEVDRRQATRYRVDLPCRLTVASGMHEARLADLSECGAMLCDAPSLEPDARGTILLGGVAMPVPFVVRTVDDQGAMHVAFDVDDAIRSAIRAMLERQQQQCAA